MSKKERDEIHDYITLGENECELLNHYGNREHLYVGDDRYHISNIYDIIGNFCYPMAMFSEVSASRWTFALRGSALFVRQDDKNIAVTTQHQLRQATTRNAKKELPECIDNVCFIRDNPLDFFRPLYIGTDNKDENESEDFATYHIPYRGVNGTVLSDSFFFPISPERIWPHNKIDNHLICVGFPESIKSDILAEMDFDDDGSTNTIQQNKVIVTATCSDAIDESKSVQSIDMHTRYDINPDGMSGGPVFYVGKTHEGYFLGLAGIILQSSESVGRSETPARFLKMSHIEKYFIPK